MPAKPSDVFQGPCPANSSPHLEFNTRCCILIGHTVTSMVICPVYQPELCLVHDTTWGQSVNKTVTKGAHLGGVLHARRHLQRHREAGKGRVRRIQSLCRAGWAHLGGVLHARRHLQRHREAGKGRVRRIQSLCRAGWASQSR